MKKIIYLIIAVICLTISSCQKESIIDFDPDFNYGDETKISHDTIIKSATGSYDSNYDVTLRIMDSTLQREWLSKQKITAVDSATLKPVPFTVDGYTLTLNPEGVPANKKNTFMGSLFIPKDTLPPVNYRIKMTIGSHNVMLRYICYYIVRTGMNGIGDYVMERNLRLKEVTNTTSGYNSDVADGFFYTLQ